MRLLRTCTLLAALSAAAPAAAQDPVFHTVVGQKLPMLLPEMVGVRIDTLAAATEQRAAASTVTELMRGRAAGLNIRESQGSVGAAPRLWIRGPASVLLRNDPLVVVDGVRVVSDADALDINVGGASTSRLEDMDPNDMQSVRVLRGPAATARYGPEGAAGVIEITTVRPAEDAGPRFYAWSGVGTRRDVADYPANFTRGGSSGTCTLQLQARGSCIPGEISSWSPLEQASPFRDARAVTAGLAVHGTALDRELEYSLSGGMEDAEGVLATSGRELRGLRASVGYWPLDALRLSATAAHVRRRTELPFGDTHLLGRLGAGLDGSAADDANGRGYRGLPPHDDFYHNTEAVSHTTLGAEVNWQPSTAMDFFAVILHASRDGANTEANSTVTRATPGGGALQRRVDALRARSSVGARLEADTRVGWVQASSALGVERLGWTLDQEGRTNDAAPDLARRSEQSDIGAFLRQAVQWRALLLQGVLRRDEPSRTRQPQWSYSAAGELALPREWVPTGGSVRLRAAYGRTERGLEALATLPAIPCATACTAATETLAETEGGVDLSLWSGAVQLGATAYRRDTENLVGAGGQAVAFRSMGNLYNRGVEIHASARGGRESLVRWEIQATGARNRNRVEADRDGFVPVSSVFGTANRHGQPLGGYYFRPILRYEDRDGDGIIEVCTGTSVCEVQLSAEESFAGSALPERTGALAGTVGLGGIVRLYARVDGERGAELLDLTGNLRCVQRVNCRAAYDPATPFAEQARVVAAQQGSRTGFVYDADYVRLREVAITLSAPRGWARRVGAAGVELTVGGRNLALWTDYPGIDPEVSAAGPEVTAAYDLYSQPPVRAWTTRVDVRF